MFTGVDILLHAWLSERSLNGPCRTEQNFRRAEAKKMLVSQEFAAVKLWEQTEPTQHLPRSGSIQFFLHTSAFFPAAFCSSRQCDERRQPQLRVLVCLFLRLKLIYLKVTALLFPTSDFRHPVTTPALLYISQALTRVPASHHPMDEICDWQHRCDDH